MVGNDTKNKMILHNFAGIRRFIPRTPIFFLLIPDLELRSEHRSTEHQRMENFIVLKHYYLPQKYSHTIFTFGFTTFELLRLYNLERILPLIPC